MSTIVENSIFERLFDMIPFVVYVIDVNEYQVIYGNQLFWEEFSYNNNVKCYEKIFGFQNVCPHCKIKYLIENKKINERISHECFSELKDKWYRLDECMMYWPDGRLVKYTIGIDITEAKKIQNELAEAHANLYLQSKELESKNKELQEMYAKMKDIAEKDYLTGLYNRRFFYEIGQKIIDQINRYETDCFLGIIDIDHFKAINDTYGHINGDIILKHLAGKLTTELRKSDIVGRIGGEEFAIILINVNENDARKIFENFRKNIERSIVEINDNRFISYTISIGATKLKPISIDHNLNAADHALYISKKEGRNRLAII
ncbi:MAG: GGDEF domain-containing protein [Calditerrivibrio sp.]|nr:GGDEF domain-containing protein [Calditerrivibrio sp.]